MGKELEIKADLIHVALKGEELETSVYFSPLCGDDDFYQMVVSCWDGDDDGVAVIFDIEQAADDLIAGYSGQSGSVDASDKPIFDAMRLKLEAALSKINAVRFA